MRVDGAEDALARLGGPEAVGGVRDAGLDVALGWPSEVEPTAGEEGEGNERGKRPHQESVRRAATTSRGDARCV